MTDSDRPLPFRRVVVGFRDASGSAAALSTAARFAQQFRAELLGLFIEDIGLAEWSASPLTRHLGGAAHRQAAFTPERLAEDFAAAATMMRRQLSRAAAELGVSARFQVERASAASLAFAGTEPGDLLVVVEPNDPMARLSYPFADLLRTVATSPAPVLFLPRRVSQRAGPVVAINRPTGEAGRWVAAEVAGALGEPLIELSAFSPEGEPLGRHGLQHALAPLRERMIVFSRSSLAAAEPLLFATIATERQVPALVLDGEAAPEERSAAASGRER